MKDETYLSLCHRCEHRASFLENGTRHRFECGTNNAVWCCYMFSPVKPLVIKAIRGERRDINGPWVFSGRARAVRISKGEYTARRVKGGTLVYFNPKEDEHVSKVKKTKGVR